MSTAAVAVGWSQYLNQLFDNLFGFRIPDSLSQAPEQGGVFNLPAVILGLAGTAQAATFTVTSLGGATQFIQTGQVRALAAMSSRRPISLPNLPTVAEFG